MPRYTADVFTDDKTRKIFSGGPIEETYPTGRVVKNILDHKGDLSMVQSKKNANAGYWNYAQNFSYAASGAVTSMQLGNGT